MQENITRTHEIEVKKLIDTSWLYDPFGDNLTYGVEFKVGKCFSWAFFFFAESINKAEELGGALLYNLQGKYKGLDGKLGVDPLYLEFLKIERGLMCLLTNTRTSKMLEILFTI